MMSESFTITKRNTLFLKGIAILCIMFHNFFHFIEPVRSQNEMYFDPNNIINFLRTFTFSESINSIFSLFGFYGTFLFIFLSGYGLTKSYIKTNFSNLRFTLIHIIKVYAIFLVSVLVYCAYNLGNVRYDFLIKVLSLTSNFNISTLYLVNGPWWFFSLIIQLYLLFIPLFKLIKHSKYSILYILLFYLFMVYFMYYKYNASSVLYANFPGHVFEFSLGIFLAQYEKSFSFLCKKKFNLMLLTISGLIVILAQFYISFFVFSFIASVLFFLSFFQLINRKTNVFLELTGKISPFLFGFHGFILRYIFVKLAIGSEDSFLKICYALVWASINYVFAFIFYKLIYYSKQRHI